MEAVRRIIDSDLLKDIITLPKEFRNRKVEIIVFPADEKSPLPSLTKEDIDTMVKGSVTESLIGVLPYSDISLDEYRAERLSKYERID